MWCAAPIGRATPSRSIRPERRRAIYRFPGLGRSAEVEQYLATRGVMVWSADFPADDWKHISAKQVTARALARLEHKGSSILHLHDIHPATARALPGLLRELQARHFHIVHVVPAATVGQSGH